MCTLSRFKATHPSPLNSPCSVGYSQKFDCVGFLLVKGDQFFGVKLPQLIRTHPVGLLQTEPGVVNCHGGKVIGRLEDLILGYFGELET